MGLISHGFIGTGLYCVLFIGLGALALSGTWSQVLQWTLEYELPRHRSMFFHPMQWPTLFMKAFKDFMVIDGRENEAGKFFESTLGGPTLLFMIYVCITTLRLRLPQHRWGTGLAEILFWNFLNGFVAPSTAIPWYFAYRASPLLIEQILPASSSKKSTSSSDEKTHSTKTSSTIASQVALKQNRSFGLLVSLIYASIVAVCCALCWKHLHSFVQDHKTAQGMLSAAWSLVRGKQATEHGLVWWATAWAKDINANPITRNLFIDTTFSHLAISLHLLLGTPSQQPRGLTIGSALLVLVLAPFIAIGNIISAGSIWALALVLKEIA